MDKYDIAAYLAYDKYGHISTISTRKEIKGEWKGDDMTTKLYEISRGTETLYGHKLATNSQGQWVMEIKGSGDVIAVDKANVQEVLPYTIGVQFETGKMVYSYLADAGKFKEGEFYILDAPHGRAIVQVVEVDTKSAGATKQFTPLAKLLTE